ncbi:MAG: lamin tail domain-containing protein [Planctomycetes bacterium]|nr:lamin tail domain-containing protein [Planctomycetota bacterium]
MSSLRSHSLLLCGAFLALPSLATAQVVINEIQYDDESTDDREFVELYNAGASAVDISGWTLGGFDQVGPNTTFTIPAATILAPGGFYVLGAATVPNVNQVVGISNIWENDQETIELRDTSSLLVDFVCYEVNKALFALPAYREGEGLWGNFQSNLYTTTIESSWSRLRDGYDTNDNGRDFAITNLTPGATNNRPNLLPYFENFDSYAVDAVLPNWGGSFKPPFAIDPTALSLQNPNPIPASPTGGNAMIMWDSVGGGNYSMLLSDPSDELIFEAYVYFDALPRPAGEFETWSLLLQGGSCSFHNHPDPTGSLGGAVPFTANGNTGIGWVYHVTSAGGTLFLIDHNNGGWGATAQSTPTILGQITVTTGLNDGWQRLRLQATKGLAEGYFGGTLGQFDGTRIAGSIDGKVGGLAIGYREFMVNNGATRPPTIDFMVLSTNAASVSRFGNATPTSTGTPAISADSFPFLGNPNFGVTASNVPANSAIAMVVGFLEMTPPLDLTLFGAQPGSALFVTADIAVTVLTNGAGQGNLPLALPSTPALAGAPLHFQGFAIDIAIPYPALPIAQTPALKCVLAN